MFVVRLVISRYIKPGQTVVRFHGMGALDLKHFFIFKTLRSVSTFARQDEMPVTMILAGSVSLW